MELKEFEHLYQLVEQHKTLDEASAFKKHLLLDEIKDTETEQ